MKRNIFIAVLGLAAAGVAYGQGNIVFGNYWSPHQTTGISYADGPSIGMGVGSEISVELFYGASTATSTSQLTGISSSTIAVGWNGVTTPSPLGTAGGNYAGSGVFVAGNVLIPGTPGSTYAFAIYASGMLAGVSYTGWSPIATGATQLNNLSTVPNLPDALYKGGFTVSAVPEPTTLALGGLGLAALALVRRKKV